MAKVTVATNGPMDNYLRQSKDDGGGEGGEPPPLVVQGKRRATPGDGTDNPDVKRRRSTRTNSSGADLTSDGYCWICHKEGDVICCETCPRVFHVKCIQLEASPAEDWVCPECVLIMTAENMDTRSRAMRLLTVDQLCTLLKHALNRMKSVQNIEPFLKAVDPIQFPAYKDYVTCPMDLTSMERNIRRKQYGSTEAMLADCKWILHNCIIFNSPSSRLTNIAKSLVKVCKHEMQEVENCPDCYLNAHIKKDSWFTEACRFPHPLVWAKLKGFPYWPGKVMRVNSENTADVRFFGAHDRAWISLKDVYLFSEDPPAQIKKKRGNIDSCVQEVDLHIKKLRERFGKFEYAPPKTPFDPNKEEEQLKILFPKYTLPFEIGGLSRRARSYSFTGSERSRDATPTPSEISADVEEEEEEMEEEEDTNKVVKEVTSPILKPPSNETLGDDSAKDDKVLGKVAESVRVSASPPCEVSSTTATPGPNAAPTAVNNTPAATAVVAPEQPKVVEAVVAETSETVVLEGEESEEIDDVEPDEEEVVEEKNAQENNKVEEVVESQEVVESETPKTVDQEKVVEDKKVPEVVKDAAEENEETAKNAEEESGVEEIDDVEPMDEGSSAEDANETEPEDDSKKEPIDPTKLLASGVSITVIDKKNKKTPEVESEEKPEPSTEEAERPDLSDIELGSDISVTVVQKPPAEGKEAKEGKFTLSLKSESELLDPDKAGSIGKARKSFPRQSLTDEDKFPPEPIVTISKVANKEPLKVPQVSVSEVRKPSVSSPAPMSGHHKLPTSSPAPMPGSSPGPGVMTGPRGPPGYRGGPPPSMGPGPRMMGSMMGPGGGHQGVMVRPGYRGPPPGPHGPMGLPSLQPRPTGPLAAPPSLPSSAGPVAEQLNKVAGKLADYMRGSLEELFKEMSQQGSPEATIKGLQLELEKMQWRHQQEMAEVKHNADLILMEMRGSMDQEKQRAVADVRKQAEIERQKAVAETKKKQWCANCGKEAIFYCCWNTSYCDYPCQQSHWPTHMSSCAQSQAEGGDDDQQQQPPSQQPHQQQQPPDMDGVPQHFMNSGGMPPVGVPRMPQAGPIIRGVQGGQVVLTGGMPRGPAVSLGGMGGMRFSVRPGMPGQMTFTRPYFM